MPITFTVDEVDRAIFAVANGPIRLADVQSHLAEEQRLGALAFFELIDARTATAALSPAEVRSIVDTLRELASAHDLGAAAVVVADDVTYGMLRMLEMLVSDVCAIRPFRDEAEANVWLAVQRRGG